MIEYNSYFIVKTHKNEKFKYEKNQHSIDQSKKINWFFNLFFDEKIFLDYISSLII